MQINLQNFENICVIKKKAVPLRAKLVYCAHTCTWTYGAIIVPALLDGSVGGGQYTYEYRVQSTEYRQFA